MNAVQKPKEICVKRDSVLDCGSPLPLSIVWPPFPKRQRTGALQNLAATRAAIFIFALLLAPVVRAQQTPHLAYVYPAGGQQGTTFQVTVGGQFLGAVSNAYVSGASIQAAVVEYNRPMNQKEFNELRDELKKLQDKWQATRRSPSGTNVWTAADQMRFTEIRNKILKNPPNRQANPAMAETVLVKITIATNAAPGEHEIRLRTPNALSNPLNFFVGQLPRIFQTTGQGNGSGRGSSSGTAWRKRRPPTRRTAKCALPCPPPSTARSCPAVWIVIGSPRARISNSSSASARGR